MEQVQQEFKYWVIDGFKFEGVPEEFGHSCSGCAFNTLERFPQYCGAPDRPRCGDFLTPKIFKLVDETDETEETEETVVDQKPGTKYDEDKLQYSLIPPHALAEVARNLTVGLKKYRERDNWKKVPNAEQRYLDALYRHLEAHRMGEIYDKDSGAENMPHMAAVAVNALFLLEFMLNEELGSK